MQASCQIELWQERDCHIMYLSRLECNTDAYVSSNMQVNEHRPSSAFYFDSDCILLAVLAHISHTECYDAPRTTRFHGLHETLSSLGRLNRARLVFPSPETGHIYGSACASKGTNPWACHFFSRLEASTGHAIFHFLGNPLHLNTGSCRKYDGWNDAPP